MRRRFPGALDLLDPPRARVLELLGQLLDQGFPPGRALSLAARGHAPSLPPEDGGRLSARLAACGLLQPGEEDFLEAAEEVGRLPAALGGLARTIREESRSLLTLLGRCAYPLLVLHVALLPMQLPILLARGPGPALRAAGLWILALDLGLGLLAWSVRRAWRLGSLERWPLLGALYRGRQRFRALFLLAELHGGGLLWGEALARAAKTVRAPGLAAALGEASVLAAAGASPGALIGQALDLPAPHRARLLSEEAAGELEAGLRRCASDLGTAYEARLEQVARGLGAALYALALGLTCLVALRGFLALYAPLL